MFPFTLRKTKGSPLTHDEVDSNFEKSLFPPFLHIQDQKPQGTHGGTFNAGDWRTRDLNTVLTNTIDGASLSNNQITLPAGKYYVEAKSPAYDINRHQARIQNTSNNSTIITGSSEYTMEGQFVQTCSFMIGTFSLSDTSNIELQHISNGNKDVNGLGVRGDFTTEVYSDIRIWRIGDAI